MPDRCVVGNCSNTPKDGVTMHKFPKDEKTRRIWTRFVQNTRADFRGPSERSVICSAHFTADCYDPAIAIKESLGMPYRKEVMQGKFPTIKARAKPAESSEEATGSTGQTTESVPGPSSAASSSESAEGDEIPAKKRRISSENRARKKMIDELVSSYSKSVPEEPTQPSDVAMENEPDVPTMCTTEMQTEVCILPERPKKRSIRSQCSPRGTTIGTQTTPDDALLVEQRRTFVEMEVQCTLLKQPEPDNVPFTVPRDPVHQEDEPESDDEEKAGDGDGDGDEYIPSDHTPSSDSEKTSDSEAKKVWEEDKFIVFQSCLLALFTVCLGCLKTSSATVKNVVGTMVTIEQSCLFCPWKRTWRSQPYIQTVPAGNLLLSAAVLFAGASPIKTFRVLSHLRCRTHTLRSFFTHQVRYLQPTILKRWELQQDKTITDLMNKDFSLVLGGDARADSPGHTAKFGSYTLMELNTNRILNIELVQKNEVSSSNAMELEGLKRCMKWMLDAAVMAGLSIECIITDRHLQVSKWIRENLASLQIRHFYDVWHISKSLKKKIVSLGRKKGFEILTEWCKSIINHLYWSASSTPDGNPDLMLEKFLSVINHMQNIHSGHDGTLFTACAHPPLEGERPRKWLTPSSEPCEKLSELLTSTRLANDIKKMSPKQQTSRVEAFHSVLNFFAPKLTVFSYAGMKCRLLLAAMHYNENRDRDQAITESGDAVFTISFPRAKSGDYILRKKPVAATFEYIDDLMEALVDNFGQATQEETCSIEEPPPVSSTFARPTLEEALGRHASRGSAIARIVGANAAKYDEFDNTVNMWVFEEKVDGKNLTEIINTTHENVKYLPGYKLPENVVAVPDVVEAAKDADLLIWVLPHQFVPGVCAKLKTSIKKTAFGISLIKGVHIKDKGLELISQMISEELDGMRVYALMGANIAKEVAAGNYCETTIGCSDKERGVLLKKLFEVDTFRVVVVADEHTVEMCGALKNIVAVGAGFVDGLKLGDNTKAAVIRLGLMEMIAFAKSFYKNVETSTFLESCGVADLITTCYGGRNRRVAEAFILTGKSLEELEAEMLNGQKLQGPQTAFEVNKMLKEKGLEDRYPLFTAIYKICYEGDPADQFIQCLHNHPEHM